VSDVQQAHARMVELEARFVAWATARPDIRAAFVIGSRARVDHPADVWSDLDIVVVTTDPECYLGDMDWLAAIGVPWLTFVEPTAVGDGRERRVLFADTYGLDVDFAIFAPDAFDALAADAIQSVVRRGMRVLVDKDGTVTRRLTAATTRLAPAAGPPTDQECLNVINDFWYHALWASKKLRRGEFMIAKDACDGHMKSLLLQMASWQAGAAHGWAYDTWHRGRFLEEWADPRVLAGLHESYASYDATDIARAVRATMRLFSWVARDTVAAMGYRYPSNAEERIVTLVETVLDAETVS